MNKQADLFLYSLDKLQPSQLYISEEKLTLLQSEIDFSHPDHIPPIPVKKLCGSVIMTDGHTRAFAAHLAGLKAVRVFWDQDELDWEAYAICVDWCRQAAIFSVMDLQGRVLPAEAYQRRWLSRCRVMQQELARARIQNRESSIVSIKIKD